MTGKRIGYIRVSSADQNPERQLEGIPLDKKFIECASGASLKRPRLEELLDYAREDDTVIVHSLDRLARNVKDLQAVIDNFVSKGVTVTFLKENLTFDGKHNAMAKLMMVLIGSIAEFERELILERQREGIAIAKKKGKYKGNPTKYNKTMVENITTAMQTRKSKTQIAKELKISRTSFWRYLKRIDEENEKRATVVREPDQANLGEKAS